MDLFTPIDIAASGLNAQRLRMTAIASNLANVDSTRTAEGGPYRRREVLMEAAPLPDFNAVMSQVLGDDADVNGDTIRVDGLMRGVKAASQIDYDTQPRFAHMPGHPDADVNGMVALPNISVIQEMADMTAASRNYEANLATIQSTLQMIERAVQIAQV
ncbi:flagellar basal body rod protein FlgC [Candidatus Sumerlaeota bacterium]|nr:flagellar basal body rod protein FlgC [Candidatus Sumerlaeota bacterium]